MQLLSALLLRLANGALALALIVISVAAALALGELLVRYIDGFELARVRLVSRAPLDAGAGRDDAARRHLGAVRLAAGMERDWFELSPEAPADPPVNPAVWEASARSDAAGGPGEGGRIFNWNFVRSRICSHWHFRRSPGFAFVFDPPAGSEYPRFRFARNVTTVGGLRTNRFGWRGDQIELRKPARTVRVAFVGASTTVNDHAYPFSYPELAGFWLNKWSDRQGYGIRVEIINAGREGITSSDIAAIVQDEVLPLEPDMIVYYEGSNQFSFDDLIVPSAGTKFRSRLLRIIGHVEHQSALLRRIVALIRGPSLEHNADERNSRLSWPNDVDEFAPALSHPKLPLNLSTIIADLDQIRRHTASSSGELVISSFFWLVPKEPDSTRDRMLIDYLNAKFFPLRRQEIERLVAFQDRVLKAFAAATETPFMDVAGQLPQDPALYWDAVHATYDGVRLQAWIVAQELAELLRPRIEHGRLPRAARNIGSVHPAFAARDRTITFDCSGGAGVVEYADGLVVPAK
jgi:hypothetical protein